MPRWTRDFPLDELAAGLDVPGVAPYVWHVHDRRLEAGDSLSRLLGVTDGSPSIETLFAAMHTDDREHLVRDNTSMFERGGPYSRIFRITTPIGLERRIADRGVAVCLASGTILRGLFIDLTEPAVAPPVPVQQAVSRTQILAWSAPPNGFRTEPELEWAAFTGVAPEATLGDGWLHAVHPEDTELSMAKWKEAAETGHPFAIENRIRRFDGAWRLMSVRAAPVLDAEGRIREWRGISVDITDQRTITGQLAESEARFRATFDNAAVGIAIVSRRGEILRANARYCAILGYTEQELYALDLNKLTHPDDLPAELEKLLQLLAGEPDSNFDNYTKRYVTKSGDIVWANLTIGPVRNAVGAIDHFIVTVQDITTQKIAEERLAESEARFRGVFERAGIGIAIGRLDKSLVSVNPAFAEMMGYSSPDALVGQNFDDLIHPEDREERLAALQRAIAGGEDGFEAENRYVRADGSILWVSKRGSLLRDNNHHPTHMMALVTDISGKRQAQAQQALLLRELNHRVKNMLSVIQSIARQTAAVTPDDFLPRFERRLFALASAHDLLVSSDWREANLSDLLWSQLAHFSEAEGRMFAHGPDVRINIPAAQTLGMAFHELATNAAKYGALSNDRGVIVVDWSLSNDPEPMLQLRWVESGGPAVAPPAKRGFGSIVVEKIVQDSFQGDVAYAFAPDGVTWRMTCPAARVVVARAARVI